MGVARLLVIAGSDSSAGAGLQADLKTAQAFGVYAQTVVTAVTAQDTGRVHAVHPLPAALVRDQIAAALSDIGADAVKIGMLANAAIAAAVAGGLEGIDVPVVLDPVLVSSSGAPLLDREGVEVLKARLLPKAALLTPNLDEAETLVGIRPGSEHGLRNAIQAFGLIGARHVLFKGGHGAGATVRDVLAGEGKILVLESPRQESRHTHGTGCTLATAVAAGLAQGMTIPAAVERAHNYVQQAIRTAPGLGAVHGPLNHQSWS